MEATFLLDLFLCFALFSNTGVVGKSIVILDPDNYSDKVYHELVAEYEYELIKTEKPAPKKIYTDDDEDSLDENNDSESVENNSEDETEESESYKDAIRRLQCNNPWFWNSFKCLYLDMKQRNYLDRTRANAKTVAWIIGPPILYLTVNFCGFLVIACCIRKRISVIKNKIEELRNKYQPGRITLDDGTVKIYIPTEEENEAFFDVMSTLVSVK